VRSALRGPHDIALEDAEPVVLPPMQLHLGWHEQRGGRSYYGVSVENGRLQGAQRRAVRAAVEKGDFGLDYQPIIDVRTREVVSLEALVRWQHPRRGTIAPGAFIGIAEASGLIVPLGEMILDQLCGQLSQWRTRGAGSPHVPSDMAVSFNVSPRQLSETDFVSAVLTRISDWRLSANSLVFEITEAALDRDPVRSRHALKELCTLGMRVCLDDFGAKPSSIYNLTTFPGQEIKLDCTLVNKLASNAKEVAIAKSIVDMAHALGLVVTAEGVESENTWKLLEELGCDQAQGFYSGRPMAPAGLVRYLGEQRKIAASERTRPTAD